MSLYTLFWEVLGCVATLAMIWNAYLAIKGE